MDMYEIHKWKKISLAFCHRKFKVRNFILKLLKMLSEWVVLF